jgi:hypothetical protein
LKRLGPRTQGAYALILRGRDGRLRCEQFHDAAMYKARLAALKPQPETDSISIDEIAELLDV